MASDKAKEYHILYGLHSRIPMCCILFFVDEWEGVWRDEEHPYVRATNASPCGYVQCPECLGAANRVNMVVCERDCGRDCSVDFRERLVC